jgi:hypothetical protein
MWPSTWASSPAASLLAQPEQLTISVRRFLGMSVGDPCQSMIFVNRRSLSIGDLRQSGNPQPMVNES